MSAGHATAMPGSRGCTPCSRAGAYGVEHRYKTLAWSLNGHERVTEPLGYEHGPPVLVIKPHGRPAPESGRADPKVDDDVKYRAIDASDIFRLARRDIGEMYSPDDAAPGDRAVSLRNLHRTG